MCTAFAARRCGATAGNAWPATPSSLAVIAVTACMGDSSSQRRCIASRGCCLERVVALDHSCQVQRHTFAERGLDLYETPIPATKKLLQVEKIPPRVWEICAGRGAITR